MASTSDWVQVNGKWVFDPAQNTNRQNGALPPVPPETIAAMNAKANAPGGENDMSPEAEANRARQREGVGTEGITGGPGVVPAGAAAGVDAAGNAISGALGMDPTDTTNLQTLAQQQAYRAKNLSAMLEGQRPDQAPRQSAVTLDKDPSNELRARQIGLATQLESTIAGTGSPSVAATQLAQTTEANAASQTGMAAASGRGNNVALALRQRAANTANIGQQAAGQGALLRAQEITDAQRSLAGLTTGARAQDIDLSKTQGQLSEAVGRTNVGSISDAAGRDVSRQGNLISGMNQAGATAADTATGITQVQQQDKNRRAGFAGGLLDTAGKLAASDERVKKDIRETDRPFLKMLDSIKPSQFSYTRGGEGTAPGERFGAMAQDLEKTPAGKSLVSEGGDGVKRVDTAQGAMATMAALAAVHKRVKQLEGDFLTGELDRRRDAGEAYIQPGGYRPGRTDRGPATAHLASMLERRAAR